MKTFATELQITQAEIDSSNGAYIRDLDENMPFTGPNGNRIEMFPYGWRLFDFKQQKYTYKIDWLFSEIYKYCQESPDAPDLYKSQEYITTATIVISSIKTSPLSISTQNFSIKNTSNNVFQMAMKGFALVQYEFKFYISSGRYFTIDWGDGSPVQVYPNLTTGFISHIYPPNNIFGSGGPFEQTGTYIFTLSAYDPSASMSALLFNHNNTGLGQQNITKILTPFPALGLSVFESAFRNCTSLVDLPSDLLAYNPAYRFSYMFAGCSSLTGIPAGLFDSYDQTAPLQTSSFSQTFLDCTSLTNIPEGLFNATSPNGVFRQTFKGCTSLTTIPSSLFSNSTNAWDFAETFYNSGLTSIPSSLFDAATAAQNLTDIFRNTSIENIPPLLFKYHPNIFTLERAFFGCSNLVTISPSCFDGCTECYNHSNIFKDCINLKEAPDGLFEFSPAPLPLSTPVGLYTVLMEGAFSNCNKLKITPYMFYKEGDQSTRFRRYVCNFKSLFGKDPLINENVRGVAPDLWNCTYDIPPTNYFSGTNSPFYGRDRRTLTNSCEIPFTWSGYQDEGCASPSISIQMSDNGKRIVVGDSFFNKGRGKVKVFDIDAPATAAFTLTGSEEIGVASPVSINTTGRVIVLGVL